MRSFARTSLARRALLLVAAPLVPALLAACDSGSSDDAYDDVSPRPTATTPTPEPIPTSRPTPTPEPTKPPPEGPGALVVPGNVRLLGATSDGFVAYYKGVTPAKSLEVYDT